MLTTVRILQSRLQDLIPGHYYYHLDTTKFVLPDRTDFSIPFIGSMDPNEFHIFDLSDEPWREVLAERLNELLIRFNYKKFLIFSHSLKYHDNQSINNIIYFPHNYFDCAIGWNKNTGEQSIDTFERKYFLSCLNKQFRIPRVYNFLKIIGKPYFDEMMLSIHNLTEKSIYTSQADQYQNEWIDEDMWNEWNKLAPSLPTDCPNDLDISHDAYHNAYINLVTETFVQSNELFFTEKIWKPIACGQLFIVIGPTGSLSALKKMGIDTFDDIIDHSRYEHIQDWKQRINAIHNLLDELYSLDWPKIYKDTKDRRVANINKFFNGNIITPYMNNIVERMSNIAKTNFTYNNDYICKIHN